MLLSLPPLAQGTQVRARQVLGAHTRALAAASRSPHPLSQLRGGAGLGPAESKLGNAAAAAAALGQATRPGINAIWPA